MMHGKNNVTKYEEWKRKMKESVFSELSNAFNKSFNGCYSLRVHNANKWNVCFIITLPSTMADAFTDKIANNEVLKNTLILEEKVSPKVTLDFIHFSFKFRIEAKTEEELNSKLMYINLMF